MSKITFSPDAPSDLKDSVHFAFGQDEFDLVPGKDYQTDEPRLLAAATAHPWLTVAIEVKPEDVPAPLDMTDPHVNPGADHLSEWATPEAKAQAQKADEAIQAANQGDDSPHETVEVEDTPDPVPAKVTPAPAPAPAPAAPTPDTSKAGS